MSGGRRKEEEDELDKLLSLNNQRTSEVIEVL